MVKAIAFVTYNTVGDDLSSGWHDSGDRRAFVIQNSRGWAWGARENRDVPTGNSRLESGCVNRVRDEIGNLWGQLQTALPELDHVVVYVGSQGSERAIALAAQLPTDKVTFVGCDCGLAIKAALIVAAGFDPSKLVLCECGGRRTMRRLYNSYMETGELLALESA
jgi:hypothetical protein